MEDTRQNKSGRLIPVKDFDLNQITSISDLTNQMEGSGGYIAKKVGVACRILGDLFNDTQSLKVLSFTANLVAAGCRGVIKELIKRRMVDIIITTCGTLDHDLARIWRKYYHGSFLLDDQKLHRKKINREGNILIPSASYGAILEEKMQPILDGLYLEGKRDLAPFELVWEFGRHLEKEKNCRNSITYWAWKNKIPVFIPGPTDGAWGSQIWLFWQTGHKDFNLNLMKEEQRLSEIFYSAKKAGALMIGGGISKHHTIWWSQFRGGLDYAVYITTAPEWDGSLSGARLREAVSWGKIKENARFVTVEGDATVLLPLIITSILK
ncbi:deoxyhypusine synthase [[Eubacterium] cellulosolvens]